MFNKKHIILLSTLVLPNLIFAAEAVAEEVPAGNTFIDSHLNGIVIYLTVAIMILFLGVAYKLLSFLVYFTAKNELGEAAANAKYNSLLPPVDLRWKTMSKSLTDAVPIEMEESILLDHDFDGIKELDNHLPPWWKYMFYATIVIGVVYFSYYIIWGIGPNQYEVYEKKVAAAEIKRAEYLATMANNVDESNVTYLTEPARLASGKEIFIGKCATCHGELGEGKIGPNLTDQYWLHGGDIKDIFTTVKYGVANKMIAWEDQLLPSEMNDVASFVLSLQGSNPPGGMGPQGDLYEPETTEETEEVEAENE